MIARTTLSFVSKGEDRRERFTVSVEGLDRTKGGGTAVSTLSFFFI